MAGSIGDAAALYWTLIFFSSKMQRFHTGYCVLVETGNIWEEATERKKQPLGSYTNHAPSLFSSFLLGAQASKQEHENLSSSSVGNYSYSLRICSRKDCSKITLDQEHEKGQRKTLALTEHNTTAVNEVRIDNVAVVEEGSETGSMRARAWEENVWRPEGPGRRQASCQRS